MRSEILKGRYLIFLLLSAFVVFTIVLPVNAQSGGTVTDDEVNKVARDMYCPVCQNIPLEVCPTAACAQWRELIREKLSAGWNAEQIEGYFVDLYGDQVLAVPPKTGFNWLIYVLPPMILAGGAVVAVWVVLRAKKAKVTTLAAEEQSQTEKLDTYLQQIERDMKKEEKE